MSRAFLTLSALALIAAGIADGTGGYRIWGFTSGFLATASLILAVLSLVSSASKR